MSHLQSALLRFLCACVLFGLSACSQRVPDTLKIGIVVAQTGPFALRGKDLINGAELAAEELNASGYKIGQQRVKVQIVAVDDRGEAEAARLGAESLLAQGVAAIIGPLNTPQAALVIPVVAAAGIPHFFTATATSLTRLGKGNAFRLLANDDLQGKAMASLTDDTLRSMRIATITETGDYGRALNATFMAALPRAAERVAAAIAVGPEAGITPQMAEQIKAARADLVVLFAREPQLRSLFEALSSVGYTDTTVLGTNVVRNKNVAALPIPVKAMYASATALDASAFPLGKAFLDAFAAKYGSVPVWGAHYSYDCVYALADALRRADSFSNEALLKTLTRIDPLTRVNQQMRFTPGGEQRYPPVAIYKVEKGVWALVAESSAW